MVNWSWKKYLLKPVSPSHCETIRCLIGRDLSTTLNGFLLWRSLTQPQPSNKSNDNCFQRLFLKFSIFLFLKNSHRVFQGSAQRGRNSTSFLQFSGPFLPCSRMSLFYLETCTPREGNPLKLCLIFLAKIIRKMLDWKLCSFESQWYFLGLLLLFWPPILQSLPSWGMC